MTEHSAPTIDPRGDLLNRVFDFISAKFHGQPKWLQALVYFLFVMFFLATAFRLVAGDYVVTGVLWQGGRHPRDHEIRIGDGFFTSNSKGIYYVVLGPGDYWLLATTRSTILPIVRRVRNEELKVDEDQKVGDFKLGLKTFSLDEFEEIDLSNPRLKVGEIRPSMSFDIVSSAFAQPIAPKNDRLLIQAISLDPSSTTRRAEFKLDLKGQKKKVPLLVSGFRAGNLPLRSSVPVLLDGRYYFEIPSSQRGKKAEIELDAKDGILWGDNEDFEFTIPTTYKTITIPGERNSVIVISLVPASTEQTTAVPQRE